MTTRLSCPPLGVPVYTLPIYTYTYTYTYSSPYLVAVSSYVFTCKLAFSSARATPAAAVGGTHRPIAMSSLLRRMFMIKLKKTLASSKIFFFPSAAYILRLICVFTFHIKFEFRKTLSVTNIIAVLILSLTSSSLYT